MKQIFTTKFVRNNWNLTQREIKHFSSASVGIFNSLNGRKVPTRNILCQLNLRHFSTPAPAPAPTVPSEPLSSEPLVNNAIDSSISSGVTELSPSDPIVDAAVQAIASASARDSGFFSSIVMDLIEQVHLAVPVPYWEAIVLTIVGLRIVLTPVIIKTMQNSARMALLRPEATRLQNAMNSDPAIATDPKVQLRYQAEMQALFKKYNVNPIKSLMWPLFQLPIFMSFFFGLQNMGTYYPGFATGGTLWFENLSIADATFILPTLNAATFLIMLEIGADGMQMNNMATFKMIMRGTGVLMIPLTMHLPQGLFVYWLANNSFSIVQTLVLKQTKVREYLNIPPPPVEEGPPLKVVNPFEAVSKLIEKERARSEGAPAEIIDGGVKPASSKDVQQPVLFDRPPPKKGK